MQSALIVKKSIWKNLVERLLSKLIYIHNSLNTKSLTVASSWQLDWQNIWWIVPSLTSAAAELGFYIW